jgi:hypothetical protein
MAFSFARRALLGSTLAAATIVCACGARGPLDIIVVEQLPADASVDVATRDIEASVEATADVQADGLADGPASAMDAAPEAMGFDGGILVNCGSCLVQSCGNDVLTCVTSQGCITALQCVATGCLTGGTPNFGCIQGCTNGNSTTEQQLLTLVGCVIGNCGMSCAGALGGLGGTGGGTGGGGGGGGG